VIHKLAEAAIAPTSMSSLIRDTEIPSFDEVEGFGLSRVSSGWDVMVALEYL
jgi:hypothetical protein